MKCSKCGQQLPDDSEFCQYCGERVVTKETTLVTPDAVTVSTETSSKQTINENENGFVNIYAADNQIHTAGNRVSIEQKLPPSTNISHAKSKSKKKMRYCSRCGGIVDRYSKRCTECGKQYFRPKSAVPIIALSIIVVVLLGGCYYQYYYLTKEYNELRAVWWDEVTSSGKKDAKITELQSSVNDYEDKYFKLRDSLNGYLEIFYEAQQDILDRCLGYSSNEFYSTNEVIILEQGEEYTFAICPSWIAEENIKYQSEKKLVNVDIDDEYIGEYTIVTVSTNGATGADLVSFLNTESYESFRVLIIVI